MKKIDDYFDNLPTSIKEKLFIGKLKDLLEKKKRGENMEIEGYAPADVKKELIRIFNNKCAFCESNISAGHHYDTEHFRPKTNIIGLLMNGAIFYWLVANAIAIVKGNNFQLKAMNQRFQT